MDKYSENNIQSKPLLMDRVGMANEMLADHQRRLQTMLDRLRGPSPEAVNGGGQPHPSKPCIIDLLDQQQGVISQLQDLIGTIERFV